MLLLYYYFRDMPSLEPSSVVCHPIVYHICIFNLISFTVRDESVINKLNKKLSIAKFSILYDISLARD